MALEELKKLRQLRRRIWRLELRMVDLALTASRYERLPSDDAVAKFKVAEDEREAQLALLDEYESQYLIRKAQRWGIEVPYKKEWYIVKERNDEPVYWLNEVGKAVIIRQIRNEQFAHWRRWAEILIPILSLIVAIIALMK